tara:strand:+ start:1956 stop:2366 length:411 start_codon:yes stop_codon:yes gene_type:complete
MADLSITASAIIPQDLAKLVQLPAAEAISQGQSVYKNSTDQWALADADAAATVATLLGIATQTVTAATQPLQAIVTGDLAMGAILAVNEAYVVSETAGGIETHSAHSSGDFLGFLGIAKTTSILTMHTFISGVAKA